jgi:uncharacterized protein
MDELLLLTPEEARVLGCLVEKDLTTPDNYPLTLNSLLAACNQKTSRDPVVEYAAEDVETAIEGLKAKGLVRVVSGAEHRVPKYKHDMPFMLRLRPGQVAALTVLLLRGAQTIGEIRTRTERMHAFNSLEEVADTLRDLEDHMGKALVTAMERLPGTKEPRFAHLLCGQPMQTPGAEARGRVQTGPTSEAIAALQADVQALQAEVADLRAQLQEFKQQFQ